MRRLLLNLLLKVATVLSLVLCLATVGGWMRNDGIAIDLDRWWLLWDSDPGVVSVYWHSDGPANLRLPFSALLLLSLLVPILRLGLTMKSRRHTPAGLCPACGYDLRAKPGRCPECGHARQVAHDRRTRRSTACGH